MKIFKNLKMRNFAKYGNHSSYKAKNIKTSSSYAMQEQNEMPMDIVNVHNN